MGERKTAFHKNIWREITGSKARYLSIMGIIFLGVAFFVGLKATGPDMLKTADEYVARYQLADGYVQSTMGLTETDVKQARSDANVKGAEGKHLKDVDLPERNQVMRLLSYDKEQKLDQFKVVKGRLPKKAGEIALDSRAFTLGKKKLKIGDTLKIPAANAGELKHTSYKIVGKVNSPRYFEKFGRGNTTVGKGAIDYFGVVPVSDFVSPVYGEIAVTFKNLPRDPFSKEYRTQVDAKLKRLKKTVLRNRPKVRQKELLDEAKTQLAALSAEIAAGEKTLNDGEAQLETAQKALTDGSVALDEQKKNYYDGIASGQNQLNELQNQITAAQDAVTTGQKSLAEQKDAAAAQKAQSEAKAQTSNTVKSQTDTENSQLTSQIQAIQAFDGQIKSAAELTNRATFDTSQAAQMSALLTQLGGLADLVGNSSLKSELAKSQELLKNAATAASTLAQVKGSVQTLSQSAAGAVSQKQAQITSNQKKLETAQQEAAAAQTQAAQTAAQAAQTESELAKKNQEIESAKGQLESSQTNFEKQEKDGKAALDNAQSTLDQKKAEFAKQQTAFDQQKNEKMPQLTQAAAALKEKQAQVSAMPVPEYLYSTREDLPGYSEYKDNANRISSIATVFPVFFFLIAALVSLTTMTHLVEERRGEIGTFMALGYLPQEIAEKYLIYAGSAALIGSLFGTALGLWLFPSIIFGAYGSLYNLGKAALGIYPSYILLSTGIVLLCTVGSSSVFLYREVHETPAILMRPKAPKAGKRIFLERITPLWKRMSFTQKVTARNLFRYKARMLMTIFGVAGGTALMLAGFGIRDSIGDIVNLQFNKIDHYQATVTFNDKASAADKEAVMKDLENHKAFKEALPVTTKALEISGKGVNQQDVTAYVPEEPDQIEKFINLENRKTGEKFTLNDSGALVTEKLARLFNVERGDTMKFKDSDGKSVTVKINGVIENYAGHYLMMSPDYAKKVFGTAQTYNTELLRFTKTPNASERDKLSSELMKKAGVINVTFLTDLSKAMDDTMDSLNIIVWVLIISAALLSFIVLYNLTNINISERIRELSTIKVLGFHDIEVSAYILRENVVLTILGILAGSVLGIFLHHFVLQTAEVDKIMFGPNIHWPSFIYAGLLTLFFSLIVMLFMHLKLKKVDMIEALKGNE